MVTVSQTLGSMFSNVEPNDLASLKAYLDNGESGIDEYPKAVEYSYDVEPQIYKLNRVDGRQAHPDRSFTAMGIGTDSNSFM